MSTESSASAPARPSTPADGASRAATAEPRLLPSLSIIVPVFNEEETVAQVVRQCVLVAPQLTDEYELILVDDGSTDASPEICDDLAASGARTRTIHHERNQGFGAAQRTGIRAARCEWVTIVPSDAQFDPADLRLLAAHAAGRDVVLGYREARPDHAYRRLKTRIFQFVTRRGFRLPFRDINWIKLYRRALFDQIEIRGRGIGVDTEIIVKARRLGSRFAEERVGYLPRIADVAKGDQPRQVFRALWELLLIRLGLL